MKRISWRIGRINRGLHESSGAWWKSAAGGALRPRAARRLGLRFLLCLALAWGAYAAVQGDGADSAPANAESEPSAAQQESEELGTFVPSEEVGAEQGVAFPVDI